MQDFEWERVFCIFPKPIWTSRTEYHWSGWFQWLWRRHHIIPNVYTGSDLGVHYSDSKEQP